MKSPICYLYVPYDVAQLVSIGLLYRRIRLKRSTFGILLDFALYTCVSCVLQTISSAMYVQPLSRLLYSQRYPVFEELPFLWPSAAIDSVTALCSCMLLYQFWVYQHQDTEVSLVCKVYLGLLGGLFLYLMCLHSLGMATVSFLDLADYLRFVTYCTWAVRLIPQISVNWFYDRYKIQHKWFLRLELLSSAWVLVALCVLKANHVQWHDKPLNSPLTYAAVLNVLSVLVLLFQRRMYGVNQEFYRVSRELPK